MPNNYIKNAGLEVKSPIKTNTNHPLDVRMLVDKVSDLYSVYTWALGDHSRLQECLLYIYDGMVVATKELDKKDRPQLFVLKGVDDLLTNHMINDAVSDPEHWLSEDNWQKLGYVCDIEESQFSFITVKYGWIKRGAGYNGPVYVEIDPEQDVDVYTIDSQNKEPGQSGYVPTLAKPYSAIKMKKDDNVLYVDSRNFTSYKTISIQTDKSINAISNLQSEDNTIFRSRGAVLISSQQINYQDQVITPPIINIGLNWQSIGPKPSNIQIIFDTGNRDTYCDNENNKQMLMGMFDYIKWKDDSLSKPQFFYYEFSYRMDYEIWKSYGQTNISLLKRFVNMYHLCESFPQSWEYVVTNDIDGTEITGVLNTWDEVTNFELSCIPGYNYTVMLNPR